MLLAVLIEKQAIRRWVVYDENAGAGCVFYARASCSMLDSRLGREMFSGDHNIPLLCS